VLPVLDLTSPYGQYINVSVLAREVFNSATVEPIGSGANRCRVTARFWAITSPLTNRIPSCHRHGWYSLRHPLTDNDSVLIRLILNVPEPWWGPGHYR
jgi:hypothetical protein